MTYELAPFPDGTNVAITPAIVRNEQTAMQNLRDSGFGQLSNTFISERLERDLAGIAGAGRD